MKIVANISVGNEVEIIDQNIAYHIALGVDAFVIVDRFSEDGTSQKLDRYRSDPRFHILHVERDEFMDETGVKMPWLIDGWMLQVARQDFGADWVVSIDADEFLFPANGDLKKTLARFDNEVALSIERRNAVFCSGTALPSIPVSWDALSRFTIVSHPISTKPAEYEASDHIPLILTRVGPKAIVRPESVSKFTRGGHRAMDNNGQVIPINSTPGIISVHFWFTTLERFAHKANKVAEFNALLRKYMPANAAWQWKRWARIVAEGPDAIRREYDRQFLSETELQTLMEQGTVRRARDHWD